MKATQGDRAAAKARGRAVRQRLPRSRHGARQTDPDRADPVSLLVEQATARVPELVPIRYGRMLASPFSFFRGAAAVMARDLAALPSSGLEVQLCGDAHLANFGAFSAPDRQLVFDVNDFDETLAGPFEWDVKRLLASFAVAGRDRGFGYADRRPVTLSAARAYRETLARLAAARRMEVWYARADVEEIDRAYRAQLTRRQADRLDHNVAKARAKDSRKAFGKLVRMVDGRPRLVSRPPLVTPLDELLPEDESDRLDAALRAALAGYVDSLAPDRRRLFEGYRFVEAARKVVGVGSVGTRAWILLMLGHGTDDPLFLQAKEAQGSVLEPFLGASPYENHGRRVVEGQRLMQSASDVLLGWVRTDGVDGAPRDYYVRQLWDGKGAADLDKMTPPVMAFYAEQCGATLARAHARSGDAAEISGYLGTNDRFDTAVEAFAENYADQNERDHAALRSAAHSGRIVAEVA